MPPTPHIWPQWPLRPRRLLAWLLCSLSREGRQPLLGMWGPRRSPCEVQCDFLFEDPLSLWNFRSVLLIKAGATFDPPLPSHILSQEATLSAPLTRGARKHPWEEGLAFSLHSLVESSLPFFWEGVRKEEFCCVPRGGVSLLSE